MSKTPKTPKSSAKRLAPTGQTLRELFLKSGNLCAFPNCNSLMMDAAGDFIGQICHIEAAVDGGERFNANMSNDDRRAPSNLMLMCYQHHVKTNDVAAYPVSKMQEMKAEHERRFANPDRAMFAKITDWTDADIPTFPTNLLAISRVSGWNLDPQDLDEPVEEFTDYIAKFRNTPLDTRRLLGAVVKRANKMKGQTASKVRDGYIWLTIEDARQSLSLDDEALRKGIISIGSYGLGDLDEIDTNDFGPQEAVRIVKIAEGIGWDDLVEFSNREAISLDVFIDDLEFGRLDD
ncbi:hypothetical protein [Brevundimonas sp. FT23042]|uniref:hypothetical protein n=1 Tax=Brevundimonas sp. FT23042 TaxID=3393749 RepID=UPI003B586CED